MHKKTSNSWIKTHFLNAFYWQVTYSYNKNCGCYGQKTKQIPCFFAILPFFNVFFLAITSAVFNICKTDICLFIGDFRRIFWHINDPKSENFHFFTFICTFRSYLKSISDRRNGPISKFCSPMNWYDQMILHIPVYII